MWRNAIKGTDSKCPRTGVNDFLRLLAIDRNYLRKMLTADFLHDMVSPRLGLCPLETIAGDTMCESKQIVRRAPNAQRISTASVDGAVPTDGQPTYSVSTWDHETESWDVRALRATKWDLRRWLRTLYTESWDHVSILIQRNE